MIHSFAINYTKYVNLIYVYSYVHCQYTHVYVYDYRLYKDFSNIVIITTVHSVFNNPSSCSLFSFSNLFLVFLWIIYSYLS